jgi:hypothetical protein
MHQVFGSFLDVLPANFSTLEMNFISNSQLIKDAWSNIRLSAHFLSEFLANNLLVNQLVNQDDNELEAHIQSTKGNVLYISNELLENAVKFSEISQETKDYRIQIGIHYLEENKNITAVIFTKNKISQSMVKKLQDLIQELLTTDLNELYIRQIEATSADESSETSGLGLLTIMNDYSARLGWKFEFDSNDSQIYTVTTMAQFDV